jgi:hypothetical protein
MHGTNIKILIYVQQDATLHNLFYIWKLLYMFRVVPQPIIRSANNYLQHLLFVTPLLQPAAIAAGIAAGSSNGVTNNRCCRYSCLRF